jgi:hypothetical protein
MSIPVDAPLDRIPLFTFAGSVLSILNDGAVEAAGRVARISASDTGPHETVEAR